MNYVGSYLYTYACRCDLGDFSLKPRKSRTAWTPNRRVLGRNKKTFVLSPRPARALFVFICISLGSSSRYLYNIKLRVCVCVWVVLVHLHSYIRMSNRVGGQGKLLNARDVCTEYRLTVVPPLGRYRAKKSYPQILLLVLYRYTHTSTPIIYLSKNKKITIIYYYIVLLVPIRGHGRGVGSNSDVWPWKKG